MPRALAVLAGSVLVACGGSSDGSSDGAPVDPCAPSPCVNGGSCGAVDGVAVCTCAGAWTGPTCATPAACDAGSFHDGTACVSCAPIAGCAEVTCAGANTSVCTRCAEGFEPDGDACRASDDCAGDPCGAHGACTDLPGAYRCTCDDGFYDDARTCAPCPSVPHCAAWSCSGPADSRCDRCEAGWEHDGRGGCSEIDPCEGAPCGDGTCVRLAADDYRCECDDGFYDSGARCARCASVAFCAAWTCTGASDSQCTSCIDGYDADGDGGCVPTPDPCRDVLPLVVGTRHGDTHGEVDDASGCTLPFSDGSTFVVGEGAEDETWSFELAARTRVTITVTGFDAALYLIGGSTCGAAALVDGACADFLATDSESLSADLNAGRYWVIVGGFAAFGGSTAGTYAITLETASPCADGSYATATGCRPCAAISGCTRTSCTSASDATCAQCDEGRVLDPAGQCQVATCELVLEPGIVAQGNTLGRGDDGAGCELGFSGGGSFVVGAGVPASAIDESYWADSVTLHEAGHWVMAAFGASPGEGGPHFLGIPYFPGQGWSEGWATWVSSDWRSESRFIDKQDGTMFWVDIAARVHSWGGGWPRPVPEDGLLGRIYELEVASMLWRLGIDEEITPNQLYLALGSERARRALRGYTRHSWTLDEESGEPVGVIDTGEPAVMLADFLDALVCNATPEDIAARVDAVTEPDTHYPYPSDAPICVGPPTSSAPAAPSSPSGPPGEHHPSAPFVLEVTGPSALKPYTTLALVARVERAPGVTAPLELTLALPQGARLVSGKQREVITTPERLVHRSYAIAIEEVPGDDLLVMASSEAGWWGGRAEAHYRFGRPAPTRARTPQREGPSLSFRGVRLGPAIPARRLPR